MGTAWLQVGVRVEFDKLPKDSEEAKRLLYKLAWHQLNEWGADGIPYGSEVTDSTTERVIGTIEPIQPE